MRRRLPVDPTWRSLAGVLLVGLLIAGLAWGSLAGGFSPTEQTLDVTHENGTELLSVPVEEGTEVVLEYEHSVERTLVLDVYVVSDGVLVSDRMEFSSFGAGLPSHAEVTRDGERYVYIPPEREFETLRVTTGHVADHDLLVDGVRYDLAGLAKGGTVEIRVSGGA